MSEARKDVPGPIEALVDVLPRPLLRGWFHAGAAAAAAVVAQVRHGSLGELPLEITEEMRARAEVSDQPEGHGHGPGNTDVDAEGGYVRTDGQLFAPPNQWFVGVRASWNIWEWGASFFQARAASRQALEHSCKRRDGPVASLLGPQARPPQKDWRVHDRPRGTHRPRRAPVRRPGCDDVHGCVQFRNDLFRPAVAV